LAPGKAGKAGNRTDFDNSKVKSDKKMPTATCCEDDTCDEASNDNFTCSWTLGQDAPQDALIKFCPFPAFCGKSPNITLKPGTNFTFPNIPKGEVCFY
jgi:hypothetical protein